MTADKDLDTSSGFAALGCDDYITKPFSVEVLISKINALLRRSYDYVSSDSLLYYDDIILDTRREAEEVLDRMQDLIDNYGMVSVADLYDLVGINGSYTDNKYGWTHLRSADVQHVREGYLLKLPKALPFD